MSQLPNHMRSWTTHRIEDLKSRLNMYVFTAPSDVSTGCDSDMIGREPVLFNIRCEYG